MLVGFLKYVMLPSCPLLFQSEVCQLVGHILGGRQVASGLLHAWLVIFRRQEM